MGKDYRAIADQISKPIGLTKKLVAVKLDCVHILGVNSRQQKSQRLTFRSPLTP